MGAPFYFFNGRKYKSNEGSDDSVRESMQKAKQAKALLFDAGILLDQ